MQLLRITIAAMLTAGCFSPEYGYCPVRPDIIERIARMEGFDRAGTLPARLHNPGSLRFTGQYGARPGARNFAAFRSDAEGWAALERDVTSKIRRGIPLRIAWSYIK